MSITRSLSRTFPPQMRRASPQARDTRGDRRRAEYRRLLCECRSLQREEVRRRLRLTETEVTIARDIIKELKARLGFLENVRLDYPRLPARQARFRAARHSASGLATQIGSSLMGVLYILDEPSIGLPSARQPQLIDTLKRLRRCGATPSL